MKRKNMNNMNGYIRTKGPKSMKIMTAFLVQNNRGVLKTAVPYWRIIFHQGFPSIKNSPDFALFYGAYYE